MVQQRVIRVLLGSPSDVEKEREAVSEIARDINDTLSVHGASRLELLRWETHTTSDIGTDAQDAVNRQIGSDFEVFIGVLWARFGTPTPRARSGTEEEFRRALTRKRERPGTHVLFYFNTANVPHDVDIEQLGLVRAFRKSIQDEGLIRTYTTLEEFQRNVRMALTRFALAIWSGDHAAPEKPASEPLPDADEGLFDLVDQVNEALAAVAAISVGLSEGMSELTARTSGAAAELTAINLPENPHLGGRAKSVVNSFAEFMALSAAKFEAQVAPFKEANARAFGGIQRLAEIAPDFGDTAVEPMRENREHVRGLRAAVVGAQSSVNDLLVTIQGQPRITTTFNRAKRRLVAALHSLAQEMGAVIGLATEAELLIDKLLPVSSVTNSR